LAILAVVYGHAAGDIFSDSGPYPSTFLRDLGQYGGFGVDIFFALSGFLITSRLIRESNQNGSINLRSFYVRRAFRILPASWAYLIVISILCISGVMSQPFWSILACLLLCRNYFPMQRPSGEYPGLYTGHFWSLAVEEHFYLFWPFLLSRMRMEKATAFAIAAAAGFTMWSISDGYFHLSAHVFPSSGPLWRTDTKVQEILWGCVSALLYPKIKQMDSRLKVARYWYVLPLFGALLVSRVSVWFPLLLVAVPLTIAATVANPTTPFGRLLDSAPLRWVGRVSYSLYLWQQLAIQSPVAPGLAHMQETLLIYPIILMLAIGSYYVIERPLIRFGHKLAGQSEDRGRKSSVLHPQHSPY
jgi:peptidoglycan/LPS O-acetylase OafA/YrhL